jgi:hypothetical protein
MIPVNITLVISIFVIGYFTAIILTFIELVFHLFFGGDCFYQQSSDLSIAKLAVKC